MSLDDVSTTPAAQSERSEVTAGAAQGGYGDLARRVRDAGLMRRRPVAFTRNASAVLAALGMVIAVMLTHRHACWLLAMTPVLAALANRTSFLGHDIGHLQVTRSSRGSRVLGLAFRRAQPLLRDFCDEHQIPYLECSALAAYAAAVKHMHRVGATLRG